MHSTLRFLTVVALAACVIRVSAHDQTSPQAGPAEDARPPGFPKLKGVPSDVELNGNLAESVGNINDGLRNLYQYAAGRSENQVEWSQVVGALNERLTTLDRADTELAKLQPREPEEIVRESVSRDRAQALVQGWATFSLAVMAASQQDPAPPWRDDLLALKRPANKPSSLVTLLTVYRQVRAGEKNGADPLRLRLRDGSLFRFEFAYNQKWNPHERPATIKHDRYIPSAADLIGTPDDQPEPQRELLSLWALVNRQLDTRRGTSLPVHGGMDLEPLSEWLDQFHQRTEDLTAFDQGNEKHGSRLKTRLALLASFTRFRHAIQDPTPLEAVVSQLALDRAADRKCEDRWFSVLRSAAAPLDGESLPAAEIWLRYLFLLSYRNAGTAVITHAAGDGVRPFWKKCGCPGNFEDMPVSKEETTAFLRWGRRPAAGHFDRAVHDATRAAFGYIDWEARLPGFESQRLKALIDPNARKTLSDGLARRVADITFLDTTYLQSYLPRPNRQYLLVSREPNPSLPDRVPSFQVWDGQSTPDERERMKRDLRQLAGQVRGMAALQQSVKEVSAATPAEWAEKMRGLSTHLGGAAWDTTALPTRTFKAYRDDVVAATKELREKLDRAQARLDLLDRYKIRKDDADIRDLEYAAALLGVEIAKKGEEMAATLTKVAELNVEVAHLAQEANALIAKAREGQVQAAQKGLVLANRARDLAAAQLDALIAARDKAGEMVKQAVQELETLRPRLMDIAQKIEDSKKSSFLSVLKAIVKVVSVALAPFTGGASLGIGAAVDQALTIVDQVAHINWDNPLQALGQLGDVIQNAAALGDFAVGQWGGADINKKWGEIKGWVKTRGDQVKKLEGDAKTFIDHLKNLPVEQFRRVAGPLANAAVLDLPVQFDPATGKVSFDLGKGGIRLNGAATQALGKSWKGILENGGMLVTDARARVGKWANLAGLDDPQLKTELPKAIIELIQTLPEGMVRDMNQARDTIKNQKERLTEFVQSTDEAGRRLLAQILSGNLVVVIDAQGQVTAVERALSAELRLTRSRIKAFEASILKGKIKEITDRIKGHQDNLSKAINAAQEAKDEGTLRKIAQDGDPQSGVVSVTKTVESVKAELEEMDRQVELARGQLADAETGVEIGQLKLQAAELLKQGAKKLEEAGLKKAEAEALAKQAADLQKTIAEMKTERAGIDLQAAARRVQSSRDALQRTYADCLRWGVNPLEKDGGSDAAAVLGLSAILTIENWHDSPHMGPKARLRRAGEGVVGQLQWVRLVGQANPTVPSVNQLVETQYTELVNVLYVQQLPFDQARVKLIGISDTLKEVVDGIVNLPFPFYVKRYGENQGRIIEWLDQPLGDRLRDQEFADVPPQLRHQVVGRFRFRIDADAEKEDRAKYPVFHHAEQKSMSYFILPAYASLVRNKLPDKLSPTSLTFLIVSPRGAVVSTDVALRDDRGITWATKRTTESLQENNSLQKISEYLGLWQNRVDLRAALGDWTVYLLSSDPDGTEKSRLDYAGRWKEEGLRFDPYIPCAMFPAPK